MTAFVLGNGQSRQHIDVDHLMSRGQVYGCNALYRTHRPHVLVATDQAIAREIQESGYPKQNVFYTRRPLPKLGARTVPREYFGFSSGPIALALAAQDRHDVIYLLGFDMAPDQNGFFNNIYAGTEYYKPINSQPTFTGNWVRQIQRILADFPKLRFVRVKGDTTADIAELLGARNLEHMPMSDFLNSINTPKGT